MVKKRYAITTIDTEDELEFERRYERFCGWVLIHVGLAFTFFTLWILCLSNYPAGKGLNDSANMYVTSKQQRSLRDDLMVKPIHRPNYTIIQLNPERVKNSLYETKTVEVKGKRLIIPTKEPNATQNAVEQEYFADGKQLDEHLPSALSRVRRVPKMERNYPQLIRIRRNTNITDSIFDDLDIQGDTSGLCKLPNDLKTVEILCKKWPTTVTCKSYCVYGSTYNEGIMRTHFCDYKKNKWSEAFEECRPFVDCKVKLVSPGNIKCWENRVNESPACQISCEIYEDKDSTDNKMYNCKSKGTWDPPLPHCVALRGIYLVPAPNVTEHADISYPRRQGMK